MARFAFCKLRAAPIAIVFTGAVAALSLSFGAGGASAQTASAERGAYIFHASGCETCHTDTANKGAPLAGGRALKTPFGTFRTPNVTPDPTHGIGKWSEADFIRALREGLSPSGAQYYPAFPYTAYTKMSDADMKDLRAYMLTLPVSDKPNLPHELGFPFNFRLGVMAWKWLNFTPGPLPVVSGKDEAWTRGRYLVEALGHCAECHTPRDKLGGLVTSKWMAGSADGAEGAPAKKKMAGKTLVLFIILPAVLVIGGGGAAAMMLMGGAGGRVKEGQHIAAGGHTVARVGLTIQRIMGLPVTTWGTESNLTSSPFTEILA